MLCLQMLTSKFTKKNRGCSTMAPNWKKNPVCTKFGPQSFVFWLSNVVVSISFLAVFPLVNTFSSLLFEEIRLIWTSNVKWNIAHFHHSMLFVFYFGPRPLSLLAHPGKEIGYPWFNNLNEKIASGPGAGSRSTFYVSLNAVKLTLHFLLWKHMCSE